MDPWTAGVFLGGVCLNVAGRDSRVRVSVAGKNKSPNLTKR